MLTYTLQSSSKTPLYVQLYESIKVDIIQGVLKKGEKLPSKRAAAKNLGVSLITVESAYGNLQSEGYIYSVPKKGFFVSEISFLPPTAPEKAKNNNIHGRVFVGFIVECDGSLSNIHVMRGIDPECDDEAVRVVSTMPKWNPGKHNGETVRVQYLIYVDF